MRQVEKDEDVESGRHCRNDRGRNVLFGFVTAFALVLAVDYGSLDIRSKVDVAFADARGWRGG